MGFFDIFKKKNKEEVQEYQSKNYEEEEPFNINPIMGETSAPQTSAPEQQKVIQPISFESKEYQDYLKSIADGLSAKDREQILTYIQNNTQIFAIKLCREATGIGLKEAKDLIDNYERYFTK